MSRRLASTLAVFSSRHCSVCLPIVASQTRANVHTMWYNCNVCEIAYLLCFASLKLVWCAVYEDVVKACTLVHTHTSTHRMPYWYCRWQLCGPVKQVATRVAARSLLELQEIDILEKGNEQWLRRYRFRIPVIDLCVYLMYVGTFDTFCT